MLQRPDGLLKIQVDAQGKRKVIACMEDGNRIDGDILVGADGIRSKVCLALQQEESTLQCACQSGPGLLRSAQLLMHMR